MHLILTTESSEEIYTLEVALSMTLADLRAYVEAETGAPTNSQILFYKTAILENDAKALSEFQMEDYDMVLLRVVNPEAIQSTTSPSQGTAASSSEQTAITNDVEKVRLQMLGDQALCDMVRQTYPELAASVNDPQKFKELLTKIELSRNG
ncbi:hypothetical protein V1514DRAFT_50360 [Lipomyces japonicus]|uniref:uncharacterized protein n=1 Tax=Lipomyces japonicus TaxID=56871 RepID=UPI0034CE2665